MKQAVGGPKEANELIARDGREWRDLEAEGEIEDGF